VSLHQDFLEVKKK